MSDRLVAANRRRFLKTVLPGRSAVSGPDEALRKSDRRDGPRDDGHQSCPGDGKDFVCVLVVEVVQRNQRQALQAVAHARAHDDLAAALGICDAAHRPRGFDKIVVKGRVQDGAGGAAGGIHALHLARHDGLRAGNGADGKDAHGNRQHHQQRARFIDPDVAQNFDPAWAERQRAAAGLGLRLRDRSEIWAGGFDNRRAKGRLDCVFYQLQMTVVYETVIRLQQLAQSPGILIQVM